MTDKSLDDYYPWVGSIIDRYILKSFLGYFFGALVVFSVIFCVVDMMTNIGRYEVPMDTVLSYYSYYIFEIAYQMLPVACLVGTVFTLTQMNGSLELTALFSMGQSFLRTVAPILLAVVTLSGFAFYLSDKLITQFVKKRSYIYYVDIKGRPDLYSTVRVDRIWFRSHNMIFNLKSMQSARGEASGLTLYFFDPKFRLTEMLTAEQVEMEESTWKLSRGQVTLLGADNEAPRTQSFDYKVMEMPQDFSDFSSEVAPSQTLSLSELKRLIERNREAGLDTIDYEVDFHSKWGFALASFVMSFLGLPFTVGGARSGSRTLALGLCIGLAFGYWVLFSSGQSLGRYGVLPPLWSAWLPNVIMLSLSTVMFVRLKK